MAGVKSNIAKAIGGLLILLLVSAAIHGVRPARNRSFVYDDVLVIRDNDFITHPGDLLHLFDQRYLAGSDEQTFRPVMTATYIIDYQIWGRSAIGFTITNLLIQLLGAWLLGLILWKILPGRGIVAATSALLYLIHPALIETATVPSNREQVLSVLFLLLSGWTWLSGRDRRSGVRWLSPLFLLLGCYTLEWSVVWPCVLWAWSFVNGDSWKKALRSVAPELAVAMIFILLWFFVQPHIPGAPDRIRTDWWTGVWAFATIFWRYALNAVAPMNLRPSYLFVWPSTTVSLLGLLALTGLVLAVFIGLLKRQRWTVGALIFILALLPVSHIPFPFWIPLADRYLALPLIGFAPLLCSLLFARKSSWGLIPAAIIAAFWFGQSASYARVWRANLPLWQYATQHEPADPTGWTNYGAALLATGLDEQAAAADRIAWRLAKRMRGETPAHVVNYATALNAAGHNAQACAVIAREGVRFSRDRQWLLTTGQVCSASDPQTARAALSALLARAPGDCDAWYVLCSIERKNIQSCLTPALIHCPNDPGLWLLVAAVHAATNSPDKCEQAVKIAVSKAKPGWLKNAAGAIPVCRRR